jgi:hypothetical protein
MKSIKELNSLIKKQLVIFFLGIFTIALAINFFIYKQKLNRRGVYIIGRIINTSFSSRGTTYDYEFFFDGKKYTSKVKAAGLGLDKNDLIFVKTIPENPSAALIVENVQVPYCLTMDSVPEEGWKELPLNACK